MKFEFTLGFWDFYALYGQLTWGKPDRLLKTFTWYLMLSIVIFASHWNFDVRAWWAHDGLNTIVFCFCFPILFTPSIGLISAWQSLRTVRGVGVSRVLVLSEEGLHQSFGASSAQQAWKAIHRVEENRRAYYFLMGKRAAIILPKRAFSSAEQIESCRQFLKKAGPQTQD